MTQQPAPKADPKNTVTLTDNATGKSYELPVLDGTEGPRVIDISKLYAQSGMFTHDPGFTSTSSCPSKITYIDGEKGVLLHRGYPIQQLAEKSNFLEVSYLLLNGELPTKDQYADFEQSIKKHTMLHDQMLSVLKGFKRDAHPMSVMVGMTGALSSFYHDSLDINDPKQRELAAHRLIAKMPTLAAHAFKYRIGQPIMYPQNDLGFAENFLYMTFANPCEKYVSKKTLNDAMEKIFILHADHEQNASTSTVRLAGSSLANPFACISAGIASLWGKSHGGANEEVLEMLEEIGHKDKIPEFIKKVKDKSSGVKLMGFGHRVYKNYDPRAEVLRKSCNEVLDELGVKDPLLDLAKELEKVALQDDYFVQRKLFPNVDFYSGIILKAMGFPTEMFTVLFATARTAGWISQWKEMIEDPAFKIGRPRQLYLGSPKRDYVEMDKRKEPSASAPAAASKGGPKTPG